MEPVFMKDSFELLYINEGHLNYFLFLLRDHYILLVPYFQRILSVAKVPFCDARDRTQTHRHARQILPQLYKGVKTSDGDVLENFMAVVEIPSPFLCVCVSPLPL